MAVGDRAGCWKRDPFRHKNDLASGLGNPPIIPCGIQGGEKTSDMDADYRCQHVTSGPSAFLFQGHVSSPIIITQTGEPHAKKTK